MATLESVPSEIFFLITRYLDAYDIVTLQHVNKRFLILGRDDNLWREQVFNASSFLSNLRRRQELIADEPTQEPRLRELARVLASGNGAGESRVLQAQEIARDSKARSSERIRILANWDPTYPTEKNVIWYDEYIARNAPISTSWLQQPRNRDTAEHEHFEVRGMGVYTPAGDEDATLVVAPLDDGSVCLWNISGDKGRKGGIVARSKSGLISVDSNAEDGASSKRSKMINTGVTECVSVDNAQGKAYFAVQSALVEVDLETLSVVSHERFPFSITALSEAKHPVPLTVGTNLSLYLHDPRTRTSRGQSDENMDRIEPVNATLGHLATSGSQNFRNALNPEPSPLYAHLHHPGPLSILHLPTSGSDWDSNGDIYVAGRFPSILNYDRRYFPKLRGTIHSGARLCSLAVLPYPFVSMEKDLARRGELSIEQVLEAKTRRGKTLIACGEYNTKGSLEMYGISPDPRLSPISSDSSAGKVHHSVMKNRQTSSSSKLLSVCNHGTRIVVSDGGGNLKWLERDGFTEVRRWNPTRGSVEAPRGMFGALGDSYLDSGSGDVVIKLANTHTTGQSKKAVNEDDLLLWTGEKIGVLGFSSKAGFTAESFEEMHDRTPEQALRERQETTYAETMGRALEANANEVRWMRGLGLGAD